MNIYIVIGEKENVYQDEIGGPFTPHPNKEIVSVFSNENDAKNFIKQNKLAKTKKDRYGDTSYYQNGYYSLEIETWQVK